ncbi:uncharacterized protein LOC111703442 [Eurytemora carolleeae]|uniref:uncharacterized protein LOC111703442 n=1 Tax=Eurytemora carolleeae TaxID=1294199 RepID=UPI000C77B9F7|nr:uncharacterized protein LOC111703442 [Eurytemora carolleeae]|eukprot:XP_023331148.1 uncharacterized protein LOC111703442 [Eurytemora affinis]
MGIQTWDEKKMEDPVKAYLLIRHTALGWESVHLKLVENIEKINKVIRGVELREMEKLPDMRDLEGAALGLGRLVSYYGQGQDNQDSSFVSKLKELNSFDLAIAAAQSANQEELYDAAYDYMTMLEQSIKMADQKDTQLLQSLGFSISDIPGYKKSIGTAHDNKLRKGGVRSGLKHQQILSKTTINQPVQEITDLPSYQTVERRGANLLTQIAERQMVELCRMKRRRISSTNLKCSFISTDSIQTLLAPFKAEEVHMNPDIVIIKQIFSEVECEETKENLKTRIQDQQGSERKGKDWSMKNVWMNESDIIC